MDKCKFDEFDEIEHRCCFRDGRNGWRVDLESIDVEVESIGDECRIGRHRALVIGIDLSTKNLHSLIDLKDGE